MILNIARHTPFAITSAIRFKAPKKYFNFTNIVMSGFYICYLRDHLFIQPDQSKGTNIPQTPKTFSSDCERDGTEIVLWSE